MRVVCGIFWWPHHFTMTAAALMGVNICFKPHLVTLFLFNSLGWRGKIEEFSYPALSRPVTWPWLGCAPPAVVVGGMRWHALPTECTYV